MAHARVSWRMVIAERIDTLVNCLLWKCHSYRAHRLRHVLQEVDAFRIGQAEQQRAGGCDLG